MIKKYSSMSRLLDIENVNVLFMFYGMWALFFINMINITPIKLF